MSPSDEQIREYLDSLPQVYKDVLTSFVEIKQDRREGDGLTTQTILDHLSEKETPFRERDYQEAIEQFAAKGFFQNDPRPQFGGGFFPFVHPSPICERLIASLTGEKAKPAKIPDLPVPVWG